MYKRQYAKSAGFALIFVVPVLPYLGYRLGYAWATPILFFLVLPLLGRVMGNDKTPPLSPAKISTGLRAYYAWLPRLYLPIWLISLIWAAQTIAHPDLNISTKIGLGLSAAMGSLIAAAVSHELMHRERGLDTWLARLMVTLIGYPTYIREHFSHHRHVGILGRGLSARVGESLWTFLVRVLPEGTRSALALESEVLSTQKKRVWHSSIFQNCMIVLAWALLFFWAAEVTGLVFFVLQAAFSIFAIQAINYVQHYGLVRLPDEPIDHELSWEDNCPIANCLTLNINYHSQHHIKPNLPYFALALDARSPRLPASYMIMFMIAVFPPFWRKVMDKRLIAYLKHQGKRVQPDGDCLKALGELLH